MNVELAAQRGPCEACPFAFTDKSEEVQDYGCLPTPFDVMEMKRESGHNWSCHSNAKALCGGFAQHVQENYNGKCSDMDLSVGGLINYETWYHQGKDAAVMEAGGYPAEYEGSDCFEQ